MNTHTTTNLSRPWGPAIAYSRLCIAYEAAAEVLEILIPSAIGEHDPDRADQLAAAIRRWEEAHKHHQETRAWAESPAPTAEEVVA